MKILSAVKNGPSYYKVIIQFDGGEIQNEYMHETGYNLRVFEEKNIGAVVTQQLLEDYKELIHDVAFHNRCMDECD